MTLLQTQKHLRETCELLYAKTVKRRLNKGVHWFHELTILSLKKKGFNSIVPLFASLHFAHCRDVSCCCNTLCSQEKFCSTARDLFDLDQLLNNVCKSKYNIYTFYLKHSWKDNLSCNSTTYTHQRVTVVNRLKIIMSMNRYTVLKVRIRPKKALISPVISIWLKYICIWDTMVVYPHTCVYRSPSADMLPALLSTLREWNILPQKQAELPSSAAEAPNDRAI